MDKKEIEAMANDIIHAIRSRTRTDMTRSELLSIDLMAAVAFNVVEWQAEVIERNPGWQDGIAALSLGLGEVYVNACNIFCQLYSIDLTDERVNAMIDAMAIAVRMRFDEISDLKPETMQ